MKNAILLFMTLMMTQSLSAQNEISAISKALSNYIEGSTNGQPELLENTFHPDLNLYSIRNNELSIWSGKEYIKDTKQGVPTGEGGKIISIDYENNVAVAKVEISHPKSPSTYIDYFLLLKIQDKWTIVHKAYTKRTSNKQLDEK